RHLGFAGTEGADGYRYFTGRPPHISQPYGGREPSARRQLSVGQGNSGTASGSLPGDVPNPEGAFSPEGGNALGWRAAATRHIALPDGGTEDRHAGRAFARAGTGDRGADFRPDRRTQGHAADHP